jgi:hypothetical protein
VPQDSLHRGRVFNQRHKAQPSAAPRARQHVEPKRPPHVPIHPHLQVRVEAGVVNHEVAPHQPSAARLPRDSESAKFVSPVGVEIGMTSSSIARRLPRRLSIRSRDTTGLSERTSTLPENRVE